MKTLYYHIVPYAALAVELCSCDISKARDRLYQQVLGKIGAEISQCLQYEHLKQVSLCLTNEHACLTA